MKKVLISILLFIGCNTPKHVGSTFFLLGGDSIATTFSPPGFDTGGVYLSPGDPNGLWYGQELSPRDTVYVHDTVYIHPKSELEFPTDTFEILTGHPLVVDNNGNILSLGGEMSYVTPIDSSKVYSNYVDSMRKYYGKEVNIPDFTPGAGPSLQSDNTPKWWALIVLILLFIGGVLIEQHLQSKQKEKYGKITQEQKRSTSGGRKAKNYS